MPHLMIEKNVVERIENQSGQSNPEYQIEWIELSEADSASIEVGDLYYSSNGLHLTSDNFYFDSDRNPVIYTSETKMAEIRKRRDNHLSLSDWTILPDSPLTASKKTEWQTYRQQLRDLPTSNTNPFDIDFPAEPS